MKPIIIGIFLGVAWSALVFLLATVR